ncbi:MAG: PTS sugar transporter subunit IIA [bacterium]
MVSVLLISHGNIGHSFLEAARQILGDVEQVRAVSIGPSAEGPQVLQEIERARRDLDQGDGVLIVTDMFGGTPSNISFSMVEQSQVEILTGLNLAMLLKILSCRKSARLGELARTALECGRESICLGREILGKELPGAESRGPK